MRIVDPRPARSCPGTTSGGELETRGPWIARQYYRTDEPGEQFSADGWLRTGDVAAISELGYLRLVDRTKDLVKSGGEWISSVELENHIMAPPGGRRGGRHRGAAPAVDGTAVGLRGAQGRARR